MPFQSKSQQRLMQAAAHDTSFARRVGIPPKTAKKFVSDSKGQDTSKLPDHVEKCGGGPITRW
jgi:hypothetical protein